MKFIIFLSFITFCLNITYTSSRRKGKNQNATGPEPKTVDTRVKTRQTQPKNDPNGILGLSSHMLNCKDGEVLQGFGLDQVKNDQGNLLSYHYTCQKHNAIKKKKPFVDSNIDWLTIISKTTAPNNLISSITNFFKRKSEKAKENTTYLTELLELTDLNPSILNTEVKCEDGFGFQQIHQLYSFDSLRYWFRCIPVKILDCHSGKTEGSSLEENSKETLIEFLFKQNIKPIINTVLTSFKLNMVETEKTSLLFMKKKLKHFYYSYTYCNLKDVDKEKQIMDREKQKNLEDINRLVVEEKSPSSLPPKNIQNKVLQNNIPQPENKTPDKLEPSTNQSSSNLAPSISDLRKTTNIISKTLPTTDDKKLYSNKLVEVGKTKQQALVDTAPLSTNIPKDNISKSGTLHPTQSTVPKQRTLESGTTQLDTQSIIINPQDIKLLSQQTQGTQGNIVDKSQSQSVTQPISKSTSVTDQSKMGIGAQDISKNDISSQIASQKLNTTPSISGTQPTTSISEQSQQDKTMSSTKSITTNPVQNTSTEIPTKLPDKLTPETKIGSQTLPNSIKQDTTLPNTITTNKDKIKTLSQSGSNPDISSSIQEKIGTQTPSNKGSLQSGTLPSTSNTKIDDRGKETKTSGNSITQVAPPSSNLEKLQDSKKAGFHVNYVNPNASPNQEEIIPEGVNPIMPIINKSGGDILEAQKVAPKTNLKDEKQAQQIAITNESLPKQTVDLKDPNSVPSLNNQTTDEKMKQKKGDKNKLSSKDVSITVTSNSQIKIKNNEIRIPIGPNLEVKVNENKLDNKVISSPEPETNEKEKTVDKHLKKRVKK